ncbi:outer membrane murein-binding lipoprotein Lpp [Mycolicibacterium sp. BK556]|uniref:copper transporter n=1 Tax=unclassified Mycolicibacterium TaxID=2636767 RepID=UPI001621F301|nr:outer membrane murein-binding lipoprotein Lpp [Mycolicibacterium sp. BK556]MBB3634387.1 outer membrane murein-binding lipoprotein Lpp [Mycolicibacterium sp. BK607]MBB3751967.1 outer membrane murein-binding lipoprotein Lpp [Mycolicibacterium sp. BK634]
MITLRHHAISLAAVFLALAVGVFLGSGVLSDTLLSGLRAEKQDLNKQITTLTDQRNAVNEKLAAADDFDTQMAGRMVRDALAGKSVVLIRTPDADNDDVSAMSRIVGQAGGTVTGTIALTQQFVDANSAEKLRSVVNSSIVPAGAQLSTTMVDQGSQAGDLLGITLLINRKPEIKPADDGQRDTVLAALRETGFVTYQGDHVGAANTAVIVTGGALGDDAGNQGSTVARFAAAMAPHGAGTVLAGRDGSAAGTSAVAVARADAGMAADVTTVDDINVESGRITTVLALQSLINGVPAGKYGIGPGATSITLPQ